VLLAETGDDLQNMLNVLASWCYKWRMKVNPDKSKIIHFRPRREPVSNFQFKYNGNDIDIVHHYKYLGIMLDEFLDYNITANVLADSAGRALGSMYSKYKANKGLGYNTYLKLYDMGITPILDYCSGVWGYNKLDKIDTIQNRAIRLYLGVHKFAPNLAIGGDTGWISCRTRRHINMLRLWNRLIEMTSDRLTRKIFDWDRPRGGWFKEVHNIMLSIDCDDNFDDLACIDIHQARQLLHSLDSEQWKIKVLDVPKLRTYISFKHEYCVEPYVHILNKGYRSALAQLRCGILPLSVETGRFNTIPIEFRLCVFCDINAIEDESHFLFHCHLYSDLRDILFSFVTEKEPGFNNLLECDKLMILMREDCVRKTSEYVYKAFSKRRSSLYCPR